MSRLRAYAFIDRLQPQLAATFAAEASGFLPPGGEGFAPARRCRPLLPLWETGTESCRSRAGYSSSSLVLAPAAAGGTGSPVRRGSGGGAAATDKSSTS